MLKKTLDFFLFSSLFISVCAVFMCYQVIDLFNLTVPSTDLLAFIFFSTACSYNFHWYLSRNSDSDKIRSKWTRNHSTIQLLLFLLSGIAAVYFGFKLTAYWFWIFIAVILTFLYSAPKIPVPVFRSLQTIAVGKTIFLSFVWTYVTAILPMLIYSIHISDAGIYFIVQRFFLIYAICIIFDYRDKHEDKASGIKTLITGLSDRGIDKLFYGSLMAFLLFSILLYTEDFSILVHIILFIPGIITLVLYKKAKNNHSDYLYYGILDGLMMVSALFTSLPWIK